MSKRKRKVRYDRLIICFVALLIIIIGIVSAFKACVKAIGNDDKDNSKADKNSSVADESLPEDVPVVELEPTLTEYNFDYRDITFTENIDTNAYTQISKNASDIGKGSLILVNNENEYTFTGVEETEFVQLNTVSDDTYYVKDNTVLVNQILVDPLNDMLLDFYELKGKQINVISGYRSLELQQQLYAEDLAGTRLDYSTLVAKPGCSEHHTGLALDFSILSNGEYYSYDGIGDESWINENCYKYGFILRYLADKEDFTMIQYESWHFRYIGIPHAFVVNSFGICYEEYINALKSFEFGERHLGVNINGECYEIYYVPSTDGTTQVSVPETREYEISGNNRDGFIVTVKL